MAYPRDGEVGSSQDLAGPGSFQWNLKIFPCSRSIAPISYRKGYGGGEVAMLIIKVIRT